MTKFTIEVSNGWGRVFLAGVPILSRPVPDYGDLSPIFQPGILISDEHLELGVYAAAVQGIIKL